MVQTKRGARQDKGSFASIEAVRSPFAPRGRWSRPSRAEAEAKDDYDELNKLVNLKFERSELEKRYEVALEAFDRDRKKAYRLGRPVFKSIESEFLRTYREYEACNDKVALIEFQLRDCQSCRTASSEASEDSSESFHRRPNSV